DPEIRPDEVELAPRQLASPEGRLAAVAKRAELARRQSLRLEPVRVRRDVDHGAESRMGDRAVVALEEVLARDLPVRADLELRAEPELQRIDVEELGNLGWHRSQRVGKRRRVLVGIDEDERPPGVDAER